MNDFKKQEQLPAYGMLAFSRITGGDPNLFGSSVKHNQKIQLTLKEGSVSRGLNNDWYLGRKTLFEVEMSYTQFAELISSMNVGDGIPVTIRYTKEDGHIPGIAVENKRTQFLNEFKEANDDSAAKAKELIDQVRNIFSEKRPIKAAERDQILSLLTRLYNEVNSHNAFILDQFDEAMEKISTEAKGEVEAFVQNKMNSLALAALKDDDALNLTDANPLRLPDDSESSPE